MRHHQAFKRQFVALWGDTWEITDLDIRGWVEKQARLARETSRL